MRSKIVAGNWKMNLTFDEADEVLDKLMTNLEEHAALSCKMIVCTPYPYLELASDYSGDSYFEVGAQDVSAYDKGAYTGEVSAAMLGSMEIAYCIVGHSERRAYHNESDELIARKVDRLLENDIRPIVCCGEVLEEREADKQFEVVKRQVTDGLFHLTPEQFGKLIIAYEPVWAIGTGKTATPEQAQEMHAYIRSLIAEKYGKVVAEETSILYGGSCKPSNAKELFANPDVDGGLIGGASLNADDFMAIAESLK
ncbi:MAG: triose-phosphate isomerase [Bacteroidales bacterium]|nr:triose-phosphate isomerase [Bacteroidales bacterium]